MLRNKVEQGKVMTQFMLQTVQLVCVCVCIKMKKGEKGGGWGEIKLEYKLQVICKKLD